MIYKIVMMSKNEILLNGQEEIERFMQQAAAGRTMIMTSHGIVNIASVDCIIPFREKNDQVSEMLRHTEFVNGQMIPKYTLESAEKEICGSGAFAKLIIDGKKALAGKMTVPHGLRTGAQEEASKEERASK